MNGIPMVATSPGRTRDVTTWLVIRVVCSVRQDSPLGVSPLDITGYHPPWKQLTEFALRPDPEHAGPQFSSLVNQMHGYESHLYGGVPGHEVYPGPPPDLPIMAPMLPYSSPDSGPPFPPGEEFANFGESDHGRGLSQIETKV